MKKYKIDIRNQETGEIISIEEISKTAKYLRTKYRLRHEFDEQKKRSQ